MSNKVKEDLEEFEGNMKIEVYQELLKKAYEKVSSLELALETVNNVEISFRDETAAKVYPTMLEGSKSFNQAAEDSYRAADMLLRVRETGKTYEADVIQVLNEMKDSSPNDTVFGRTVRRFLTNQ